MAALGIQCELAKVMYLFLPLRCRKRTALRRQPTVCAEYSLGALGAGQRAVERGEAGSFLAGDSALLGEVHVEVHSELPNTVILPD